MKKIFTIFLLLILLTGCSTKSARNSVESYLKQYKNLSSEVLVDMENVIQKENLSKEQENVYREILKKQYKDLSYEILEEEYDDDVSYITVKLTVYDLYQVQNNSSIYLKNNVEKFNDENGVFDNSKYIDYKLEQMKNTTDKIEYKITFTVTKEDGEYNVMQPSEEDLMKVHGIYNDTLA